MYVVYRCGVGAGVYAGGGQRMADAMLFSPTLYIIHLRESLSLNLGQGS